MIDRGKLVSDLQSLLRKLEADLLERSESREVPEVGQTLRNEHQKARQANRTAQSFEEWRSDYITQIAAAWVLSCVFARFLEDNRLIDPPKLAGPGDRLIRARDEHELYFKTHPTETDRDYLLHIFAELRKLPGGKEIFGEHNSIHELPKWLSGDAAGDLLKFFQRIDANTGVLVHDFTDPIWDTRFLGDLYQDLSETARKKYALLQTPIFVEEFILNRTLDPAIDEFGLEGFRMIDPASGSGHFLLGSFHRILQRWLKKEPSTNVRVLVQQALDSVHGVDVNPYAVAITRFRLLLVALRQSGISRLQDAPDFHFNVGAGDSLLHGVPGREQEVMGFHELAHRYQSEDLPALRRILNPGTYHAVVANPPYITVKDRALNQAYRDRYSTCHMKYSLSVPFMERVFQLAVPGGYTGQITSNSFMKREFGKKLIEEFFPRVDLTHVIDTSGAYIPGHATPTVILLGRHRHSVANTLRTVMGIRGEPTTPEEPAKGIVWSAIVTQVDQPGSQSEFVSVADSARGFFHKHPWSIGGGGAADLKERLDENAQFKLEDLADSLGVMAVTAEDDAYIFDSGTLCRQSIAPANRIGFVEGDMVRDWRITNTALAIFPYSPDDGRPVLSFAVERRLWPLRKCLESRLMFQKTQLERGLTWFEYGMLIWSKYRTPFSITFGEVATHNHFVFDRGGKVFKQTAPVIKLSPDSSEDDYLVLLGYLNSSTAAFWMKQVAHPKQMTAGDGVRIESKAKVPHAFSSTQVGKLPIPATWRTGELRERLLDLTRRMDRLTSDLSEFTPMSALESNLDSVSQMRETWKRFQHQRKLIRSQMVLLQEEIDFIVYAMYGFVENGLLSKTTEWPNVILDAGDRPFEIVRGRNEDGFPVPDCLPGAWPTYLRDLWQFRIDAIGNSSDLRLIEDPHYKRRWIGQQGKYNLKRDSESLESACVAWLLNRLESYFDLDGRMNKKGEPTARLDINLISIGKLADIARQDQEFMHVGELYREDSAFDLQKLIEELVIDESVPLLPVLRYKDSGLRKRFEWEQTWGLQRKEDAIDARTKLAKDHPDYLTEAAAEDLKRRQIRDIPVPPKYTSGDFLDGTFWRLRGKLDVPKERWVSFPCCEGEDRQMIIAWAGYDHLQLARTISAYYVDIQERLGGRDDPRLVPLLACLVELLPWLKQWHDAIDPEFNMSMADYFEDFVQEEARQMGKTVEEIKSWKPPKRPNKPAKKKMRPKEDDPESRVEI